jgi:hypothetical protein
LRRSRLPLPNRIIANPLKELRRGRIEPQLATRLSTMLVNHRSMLECALLEAQIEEMRLLLASDRAIPPLITARAVREELSIGQIVNSD